MAIKKERSAYQLMSAKIDGMLTEITALDGTSRAELSEMFGHYGDYIQKKSTAKALTDLKFSEVMLIAQKCGRRIRIEEVYP